MAKIYGLFGAMTGKLADTVMSVRNGEQIARKYQPVVYNPSTTAQIAQRAKLKLMSQISAVLAPVIAIPKQGAVSSRNLFTKRNFPLMSYSDNTASVTLANIQLTTSAVGLPNLSASRTGTTISADLAIADNSLDRVIYVVCLKNADESLRFFKSVSVENSGAGSFATEIEVPNSPAVLYAYGVRLNSEAARVIFGNLTAEAAETIGKLVTSRTLTESDITLTETQGMEIVANRDVDPDKKVSKTK